VIDRRRIHQAQDEDLGHPGGDLVTTASQLARKRNHRHSSFTRSDPLGKNQPAFCLLQYFLHQDRDGPGQYWPSLLDDNHGAIV